MTTQATLDRRMTKLETKHDSLKERVDKQEDLAQTTQAHLSTIKVNMAEMRTDMKWVKWFLFVGIPAMIAMQGWDLLSK